MNITMLRFANNGEWSSSILDTVTIFPTITKIEFVSNGATKKSPTDRIVYVPATIYQGGSRTLPNTNIVYLSCLP